VNEADDSGGRPLHWAAQQDNAAVCKVLGGIVAVLFILFYSMLKFKSAI
jgi:ankyrin repeat protein